MAHDTLDAAVAAVAGLFAELDEEVVDSEVCYFIAAAASEVDAEPEDLCELLATYSPAFVALPVAAQQQRARALVAQAQQQRGQGGSGGAAAEASSGTTERTQVADAVVKCLREGLQLADQQHGVPTGTSSCSMQATSEERQRAADQRIGEALQAVCALPQPAAFLVHVYRTNGCGALDAAAAWLLEQPPAAQEAARHEWEKEEERRAAAAARAAAEQHQLRRLVVERYQLEAVAVGASGGKPRRGGCADVQAWGTGSAAQEMHAPRVRYLEGQVVSTKGEKRVVVKTGEEWDGGSRGKIYTKGTRGKGFM